MREYCYKNRVKWSNRRHQIEASDPLDPHTIVPLRSPKAVSVAIKDIIKDKLVCELGCAEGDNMAFMSEYATKVIGFELMPRRGKVAEARGFNMVYGDYFNDELPEADVYYFWPNDGCRDNEFLVNKLTKLTIVGADTGYAPEKPCLMDLIQKHNGRLIEVDYHEGDWSRGNGKFLVGVFYEV